GRVPQRDAMRVEGGDGLAVRVKSESGNTAHTGYAAALDPLFLPRGGVTEAQLIIAACRSHPLAIGRKGQTLDRVGRLLPFALSPQLPRGEVPQTEAIAAARQSAPVRG